MMVMSQDLSSKFNVQPVPVTLAVRLDGPLFWMRKVSSLVTSEIRTPVRLPLRSRFRGWRHGYTSVTYAMYDLEHNDPGDYLSHFAQKVKTHRVNGAANAILDDKLGVCMLMDRCGAPHPGIEAMIRAGRLYADGGHEVAHVAEWLEEKLGQGDGLVLKPLRGYTGKGFVAVRKVGSKIVANGVEATLSELSELVTGLDRYFVSPFIVQAEYARQIFPGTTNTIRFLTMWDIDRREPFIALVAHRFGLQRSHPVDNWKSGLGGLSAPIEFDSGELGPAVQMDGRGRLTRQERHPETGSAIAGVAVTGWSDMKNRVLELAQALPSFPEIGWDCVVTDSGFQVLEVNGASDLTFLQVHQPLLTDPRVRKFYAHYGVI